MPYFWNSKTKDHGSRDLTIFLQRPKLWIKFPGSGLNVVKDGNAWFLQRILGAKSLRNRQPQ